MDRAVIPRLAWPPQRQHIAVLILIPLIMAAMNSNWLYSPIGYLDPWYNVGYFLHYGDPAFRPASYKISRLSWLLPGWVLYHIFWPQIANFVLHIGALLLATIFVYLTLARLVARDIAFLAAVFLTVYYPFHGSGGWDYQTTGSGAFYALTLYFLTRAGQSQSPARSLFASGMAFAATFHANLVFVNMVPVLIGQYLIAGRDTQPALRRLLQAIGPSFAGFIVLTLALCVINRSIGRDLLFFQPILDLAFNLINNSAQMKIWWSPWSSGWVIWPVGPWPAGAYYLAVPLATMLVGVWVLLRSGRRAWSGKANRPQVFLIAQFLFLGLLWIVWQSLGDTALQPDYFAYPLIIPCVLGLAGIMAIGDARTRTATNPRLVPATLLLALLPGADLLHHVFKFFPLPQVSLITWETVLFVVALLLATAMIYARARPFLLVAAIGLFQIYFPLYTGFDVVYSLTNGCPLSRTGFAAVIALDRLANEVSDPDHVWLWMGPQEITSNADGCGFDLGNIRASANSMSLSAIGTTNDRSASDIPDAQITGLKPGDWIALVTMDPANGADIAKRLHQMQKTVGPTQQLDTTIERFPMFLQLVPIIAAPSNGS